ncbi:MAG: ABC transporter ATP-binding protein, partial [Desulfobacteraceae bacterium]|nr:ABC transporter ATP-binding protein [Desulfobacteraceae bacterium]
MAAPFIRLSHRHRQLLALIRAHWGRMALSMICMLVIAGATAATAYLVKPVLDDIFFERNRDMLRLIPLLIIGIYLARGVGMYVQSYLMSYVGERIILALRTRLYDRIQDLSVSFFQRERTGVLMSRITNDVNIIKAMVSVAVTSSLRDAFTILGLIFVIFYRDWKMAIFALVILPAAFFPVVEFGRRVRRASTGCQEAMADMSVFLHETIAGNKIVKAFGMEAHEKRRFREKCEHLFRVEIRAVVARSLSSPVMEFLGGLGIAFIIWYGGAKVIDGTSTAGTFFSFMAAVLMLYDPVKKLSALNNTVQQGLAAVDRVFDIIETPSEIVEDPDAQVLARRPHRVAFHDVWFRYEEAWVLQGIDLSVREGEVLALVGMSGGGKTTLVNLIPRFFDVTRGRIAIDDLDIRRVTIASLRDQIALVTQEPILFNDTVRNNIAYGRPDATEDEIIAAATAAYA